MSQTSDTKALLQNLQLFGLSAEDATLYLFLLQNGPARALEANRALDTPRTNIYRSAERLAERGLIRFAGGVRGRELVSVGPRALEDFLSRQQRELDERKRALPAVLGELANVAANELGSRVMHYDGVEGIRQITRNSVNANNLLRIFELSHMAAFFEYDEAEAIRRQFVERDIFSQQLSNSKRVQAWTDVTEQVERLWQCRYVDPAALHFEYELLIYDDVYAAYSYNEHDVFGIEIHSAALARTQARLFDFVWANALPMNKVGHRGEARLIKR